MTKKATEGAATAAPASQGEATELEALKAQLAEILADKAKLEADFEALKVQSEKAFAAAEADLEDAAKTIDELKAQLDAPKGKTKGPVVEIGKSKYLITSGLVHKQKLLTADDVAADIDLVKKLIEKGSTIPQLID